MCPDRSIGWAQPINYSIKMTLRKSYGLGFTSAHQIDHGAIGVAAQLLEGPDGLLHFGALEALQSLVRVVSVLQNAFKNSENAASVGAMNYGERFIGRPMFSRIGTSLVGRMAASFVDFIHQFRMIADFELFPGILHVAGRFKHAEGEDDDNDDAADVALHYSLFHVQGKFSSLG